MRGSVDVNGIDLDQIATGERAYESFAPAVAAEGN
jgi:hypothetical protein